MPLIPRAALILTSLVAILGPFGCSPAAPPGPAPGEANYGENKLPPPGKAVSTPGKGAPGTGAPPLVR